LIKTTQIPFVLLQLTKPNMVQCYNAIIFSILEGAGFSSLPDFDRFTLGQCPILVRPCPFWEWVTPRKPERHQGNWW